jgi:predicted MFS family arabinose efflux permease
MSGAAGAQEWKVVGAMALGFGLVGIDRFLISPLFPTIARELGLNYGDIGTIAGALALAWGIAALLMGSLSDRIGQRKVLVGALILFSLLIGASGLATGLGSLIAVRLIMGVADGAFTPASIAATLEASAPRRRGLNIGIQQMMLPLCGLAFAPWLVGFLLPHIGWRWIFALFGIPGLALAAFVWKVMPDVISVSAPQNLLEDWRQILAVRNVRLLMLLMPCWLTCLVTTSAFLPSYLVDYRHLSNAHMGFVMTAIGLGSTLGTLALPTLSDIVGRKPVLLGSTICAAISLSMLGHSANAPAALFLWLGSIHFCNNACITLTVGPMCAETVPPPLVATATGLVIACGEFAGGGLAPIAAGQFADHFGIEHVLWLPLAAMSAAFIIALFIKETRWSPSHG